MADTLKIASKGSGIPLVLIHGWGLNSGVWQPVIDELAQFAEVITIDLPGFATNNHIAMSPYSLEVAAEMIQAAINKPAVYLGWSLGGLVATQIALSHPEQVKGLITVASTPKFVEAEHWPGIKPDVLAMFHQQLAKDTEKTINNFLKIQAMGSSHIRQDIKRIRDLVMQHPLPSQSVLDESLYLLDRTDLSSSLELIEQPFFRLYGKLDSLVPKTVIPLIDNIVPSSQCYIFEQASHAPFISHQEEFIAQVLLWLSINFKSH